MARKRLGEILIEAGAINEEQLKKALVEQRRWGRPLGRVLLDMHVVEESALVTALSSQLHIPIADVSAIAISSDALDVMPAELAQMHNVLPFRLDKRALDVAMSDPTNLGIIDELRIRTRLDIQPHIAGPRALEKAIRRWYLLGQHEDDGESSGVDPATVDIDDTTQRMMLAREALAGIQRSTTVPPPARTVPPPAPSSTTPGPATLAQPGARTKPPAATTSPYVAAPNAAPAAAPANLTLGQLAAQLSERQREIESLQTRLQSMEHLRKRDEDLIRQLCLLLIEKNVVTRDEIVKRMNRAG